MPVIRLIRHAQATYGSENENGLTELGVHQAELLDEALARGRARAQRIAVGTLRRQADTALACRRSVTTDVSVDARWDEFAAVDVLARHGSIAPADGPRNSLGAPSGLRPRHFQTLLDDALTAWVLAGERSPCAESWPAFQRRAVAALNELAAALSGGEEAWAFTSAGVIAAIATALLDAPAETFLALNRVSVNASMTTIMIGAGGARLLSFNNHGHLEHDRALMSFR